MGGAAGDGGLGGLAGSTAGSGAAGAAGASGAAGDGDSGPSPLPEFSDPTLIDELAEPETESNDDDPELTADLTEIYFNSDRIDSNEDIWRARRASPSDDWDAPELVEILSSPADRETGIALTPDGLTIWFSSDREGDLDIFKSTRDHRSDEWSAPQIDGDLSTGADDLVSSVSADALTLYLARRDDDSDDYDIYVTTRSSITAAWEPPQLVEELLTDSADSDASPVQGGWGLMFTRDEDLFFTQREQLGGPFGEPISIDKLNSSSDDGDLWAADDLSYVVFSSDRTGRYQIYEAIP